jgi:hypothetical protein
MTSEESGGQYRRYLRISVKLMLGAGLVFLLVPFLKSLPWLQETPRNDAAFLPAAALAPGETRALRLVDGSSVFVTRSSPEVAAALRDFPAERLWFHSAPGLASQPWFVFGARNAVDETVRFLPAQGAWPGGFVADSGSAWDLAGRALKPGPGHPGGSAMKTQNLLPLPFRQHDDGIELPVALAPQ